MQRCGLVVFATNGGRDKLGRGRRAEQGSDDHSEEQQKTKRDGARSIEQDIAEGTVTIGQEGLVKFVGAGDEECGSDGKAVSGETVAEAAGGFALDHAEGAEADEREEAIAHEVAGFADHEVDWLPVCELIEAEDRFRNAPKRSAGVIRTAPWGGFKSEDEEAREDREPGAQQERG